MRAFNSSSRSVTRSALRAAPILGLLLGFGASFAASNPDQARYECVVNGNHETPVVIPILHDENGKLFLDTVCFKPENVGRIFSLARAYFMADMEVPSAYVSFLRTLMS